MTWSNRLRLIGGILAVLLVMSALTLLFNQRQSRVASTTAAVDAPIAVVGSGYGGVVTEQYVEMGDSVQRGDELFSVVSHEVQQDVRMGFRPESNDAYSVDIQTGTITHRAVIDGQVTTISATRGSYLQAGSTLATITATEPKTVLAEYDLEPTDYGRVERGASVILNLADDRQLDGTVTDIGVITKDGLTVTTVRVESAGLADPRYEDLTRAGSPVQAVLSLRDEGILAGPTHAMMQFLTKIGLR